MNKFRIKKLKITPPALRQLQQLQLSLADLDLIICFSRKVHRSGATLYRFDPTLAPAAIQPQLSHLTGLILHTVSSEVVEIYRDTHIYLNIEKSKQTIT
jgi:hypothetical protein